MQLVVLDQVPMGVTVQPKTVAVSDKIVPLDHVPACVEHGHTVEVAHRGVSGHVGHRSGPT